MGGPAAARRALLGALSACFDAPADFLITYAPFRFMAGARISVGVRFSMDI